MEPKQIKLGNLRRSTNSAIPIDRKSFIIQDYQRVEPIEQKKLQSGLNAVFLIDIDNELSIKRANGNRIDPTTNKVYHLEFDAPLETAPVNYNFK